jgi:hypothetical protein
MRRSAIEEQAGCLAVFAQVGNAMAQGVGIAAQPQGLAAQSHGASPRAPQAAHGFGQFAAARAHQAGDSQDLAPAQRERNAVDCGAVGKVLDFQQGLGRRIASRLPGRVVIAQVAPHHAAYQRIRRKRRNLGAVHVAAVTQHGDAVAVLEDLCHAVADVDDADALGLEVMQDAEQRHGLHFRQRGGGFVQDQHLAVQRQGAGNLDQLLARYAQRIHPQARVDVLAQPPQHGRSALLQAGIVHPGLRAGADHGHENVLGHGRIAA